MFQLPAILSPCFEKVQQPLKWRCQETDPADQKHKWVEENCERVRHLAHVHFSPCSCCIDVLLDTSGMYMNYWMVHQGHLCDNKSNYMLWQYKKKHALLYGIMLHGEHCCSPALHCSVLSHGAVQFRATFASVWTWICKEVPSTFQCKLHDKGVPMNQTIHSLVNRLRSTRNKKANADCLLRS